MLGSRTRAPRILSGLLNCSNSYVAMWSKNSWAALWRNAEMTAVQPLRLGISGAVLALIACAVWFISTDQASQVRRHAFEARDQSLAAARAAQNGLSVEEMKRQADAACRHILVDP